MTGDPWITTVIVIGVALNVWLVRANRRGVEK